MLQVWYKDSLQGQQNPQIDLSQAQDKDPEEKKSGIIYCHQCSAKDLERNTFERHLGTSWGKGTDSILSEDPAPIQEHRLPDEIQHYPGKLQHHRQGGQDFTRIIKESIFIRVNNPTLNRNIGKFQLSHIWDRVLVKYPWH